MRPPASPKPSAFDASSAGRPRADGEPPRKARDPRDLGRDRPGLMGLKGLGKSRPPDPGPAPVPPLIEPDPDDALGEADRTILRLLQANGRVPNVVLAQALQLPPSSVHKRIRRLVERRYILQFEALLSAPRLQAALLVFVQVQMDAGDEPARDHFRATVQACDSVLECHAVANGYDYLLKLRVADVGACHSLLSSLLWPLRGVRSTRTLMVMEEVKYTGRIAV